MSILSFTAAPLDFRLRGRWVAATVEEVKGVLTAKRPAGENLDEALRPAVEALLATTTNFDASWRRLMEALDSTGLPGHIFAPLARNARATLDSGSELLSLLREHTGGYREELERSAEALGRIDRDLEAVEKALAPSEPDYQSIDRGLAEAARGEGEDAGAVLTRFLNSGEL